MYCTPGPDSSNLIKTENAVPTSPENKAKIRYNVPISFAFEDKNHLSVQREIDDLLIYNSESISIILCLMFWDRSVLFFVVSHKVLSSEFFLVLGL